LQDGAVAWALVVRVKFKIVVTRLHGGFCETVTVNFKLDAIATLAMKRRTFVKPHNGRKSLER